MPQNEIRPTEALRSLTSLRPETLRFQLGEMVTRWGVMLPNLLGSALVDALENLSRRSPGFSAVGFVNSFPPEGETTKQFLNHFIGLDTNDIAQCQAANQAAINFTKSLTTDKAADLIHSLGAFLVNPVVQSLLPCTPHELAEMEKEYDDTVVQVATHNLDAELDTLLNAEGNNAPESA